jgi:hypothetical protein
METSIQSTSANLGDVFVFLEKTSGFLKITIKLPCGNDGNGTNLGIAHPALGIVAMPGCLQQIVADTIGYRDRVFHLVSPNEVNYLIYMELYESATLPAQGYILP